MTKNYESGRSMVEMLGSLAIIGVLSVGAIVGYSYAMDKYRANRTMNDVRLRGMDVLAQFDTTGTATLDSWKDEPTLYPISLEEGTIGIQVDNVPQRVCEMIAEGMEHSADIKFITSNEATTDCGDKTTMVFYFDDDPTEDEGTVNEPVREQCGETLCEQCFKCDQDTMTCVSAMDELYETADNVDDFRICASNGYKSYCGLLGDGCAELGSANCAGMGDPECVAYIDGSCQPLDSSMYLPYGLGGFRCTKDGVEGYCMNGQCSEGMPEINEQNCEGAEDESLCAQNGQTGICLLEQCLALCSNPMGSCDTFGKKGVCVDGLCAPLTDDGCHVSLFGQTIPIPNEYSFACEKDGVEGVCVNGACGTDPFCIESENGTTCTTNGENGTCINGSCLPIETACADKANNATCTKDGITGKCSYGQCIASCSNIEESCDAFGQDGYCSNGSCYPLIKDGCRYDVLNDPQIIPDGFACKKDGEAGVCIVGACVPSCASDSDCTDASQPYCRDDGVCVGCTSHDHCGTNQYCGDANSNCEQARPQVCKGLNFSDHAITYTDTNGVTKTETFYISNDIMSWWDAEAACAALGNKKLLSVSDLVTKADGSTWENTIGTHLRTDLAEQLYSKVSNSRYEVWSSNVTLLDSCFAYLVDLEDGYVTSYLGRTGPRRAVCK